MFAFLRLVLVMFVCLTLIYVGISISSRERRRAKLKQRWRDKHGGEGLTKDRQAFIQRGLKRYDRSLRRHLILLVYILPFGTMALVIYVINFS